MLDTGHNEDRSGARISTRERRIPDQTPASGRMIMPHLVHGRGAVLAGTLAPLLWAPWTAAAQQQAPLPPGSPLMGRPDTEAAKNLAPVAPPPIPTAADKLPTAKLKAPT